jgi:hypothetical protein
MLSRAGLGDDALGAQALCEQRLTDRIVDLVCACVRQVFALQPDLRTPALREPCGVGEGRWTTYPAFELQFVFDLEIAGVQMFSDAFFEALQSGYERLGHVAAAERAKASVGVREFAGDGIGEQAFTVDCRGCHLISLTGSQAQRACG